MKFLKIFNINAPRNKSVTGNLAKPDEYKLAIEKMLSIQREINNNPKFLHLLVDNLDYLNKTIDNLLISDNNLSSDKMFLLVGQKKAYSYLYNILTLQTEIKDKEDK